MKHLLALVFLLVSLPVHAAKVEVNAVDDVSVWIAQDAAQPIATVRFVFTRAGYAYDEQSKQGLSQLTLGMVEEGAGTRDALAFKRALDDKAIKLSSAVDADHVYFTLTYLKEHQTAALALLQDVLTAPTLSDEALQRVKMQTKSAIKRMQERPEFLAGRAWRSAYFGSHPYAQEKLGTEASVDALTQEDIRSYIARNFTSGNMLVLGAGDIDREAFHAALRPVIGALPKSFTPSKTLENVTAPASTRSNKVAFNVPQSVIQFGGAGPKRMDKDFMAAFVLNHILGGATLTSRLGTELREKSGLTYGITTGISPMEFASVWGGDVATRAEQAGEAAKKLTAVVDDVAKHGVSADELRDAKAYLTGSFALSLDTNAELVSFMTTMALYGLGADYLDKRNALIEAVTLAEVGAAAARYLQPSVWPIVTVGMP